MKKDTIEVSREKIENKINEILDKEIKKYENNEFVKNCLEELKRLSAGGKRVRGYLVKLGAMLFGKNDDCYIDIAAALEIFQTAILIHDDIIDEAEERRGMETINAKYSGHFGISKAICIGDLGFFLSYRIINKLDISETLKEEISRVYSKPLYNTVNGEIIDVELPLKDINYHKKMDDKIIYDIYINKTAWYTIIGPVLIGAASASASYSDKEKLKLMGTYLGIAFQIKDDLLGLYSTSCNMGKTLNDIKEGKQTTKFSLKRAFPMFILYFVIAAIITTVCVHMGVDAGVFQPIKELSKFMIIMAMAAIGLNGNVIQLIKTGGKPIIVGASCWCGITVVSLIMQHVMKIW